MVIEWLKFRVSPELRNKFIVLDEAIWTKALETYAGFMGKEVWVSPNEFNEVVLIIYWNTREEWKTIPQSILDATDMAFASAMGRENYLLQESLEYQVRKFPGYH